MPAFSEDQVIALAPDESSARSSRDLANPRKWVSYGASEKLIWGVCQGSGASPYQTCIDTGEPAFKCSCPSKKFPCKHALGLFLLFCRTQSTFEIQSAPGWASQWLQSRSERLEKKAKKKETSAESAPDPAAKAKRQADRKAKVDAGVADLSLWMQDRVRQGIAGLESRTYQFWDGPAARLVDAQAPGLARVLRQCAGIPNSGEGWQEKLLERFSLMHLASEGFSRIDELDEGVRQDLRSFIGFTVSQEELLKENGTADRWQILGQRLDLEDRLKIQRTWLRGENTKQWALVLSFAYGMQPLDVSLQPGCALEAELVFFPAALKLRSLVKTRAESALPLKSFVACATAEEFLEEYASSLSLNPWLESFPVALDNVTAGQTADGRFMIVDREKTVIPVSITDSTRWQMLAFTGGHSFSLFGEWNGESFLPLSLMKNGFFARLDQRLAMTNV